MIPEANIPSQISPCPGRGFASHTRCAGSHRDGPDLPCNHLPLISFQSSALFIPTPKKKKQKPDSEFIYSGVNPELLLGIQYIYPLPTQLQTLSSRS